MVQLSHPYMTTGKTIQLTGPLPTKVRIVKAMVFPVVMNGCESWTIKNAEHQRIDTFNCGAGEDSFKSPLDNKESD